MNGEHEHEHKHDHEHDETEDEALELELDSRSQIFLEMRQQNLELLQIAVKVAGYSGEHGPLKAGDARHALKSIWDIYAEFYSYIDPEESEDDEDDEDDEE